MKRYLIGLFLSLASCQPLPAAQTIALGEIEYVVSNGVIQLTITPQSSTNLTEWTDLFSVSFEIQAEEGQEYFRIESSTEAAMANSRKYDIELKTTSTDAVPEELQGERYWYDSGLTENGEKVYYDNATGQYAIWYSLPLPFWQITSVDNVGVAYDNAFLGGADLSNGFNAASGAWSGTLAVNTNVLADAWYRAETEAFDSLTNYTGCTEGVDCFRGFLPVQGDSDDYKRTNVWQMTSGTSGDFDEERLTGDNALWCSLRANCGIESLWETREQAMKFAGLVEAWLKETDNLKETGNVTWLRMVDLPEEPQIYRTQGENRKRLWELNIELELIYSTETVYS